MLAGAVVGALVGAAIVAAAAVAAPLTIAIIVGGSIAMGALSMKQIASGLSTIFKLPEPTTAAVKAGSQNVFVNRRPAVRAGVDMASPCTGFPMAHGPMITDVIVAQGSSSVYVNGAPFARLKDKLACGAHISSASENVFIGGETQGTGHFIWDLESWMETGFAILGGVALIGAAGLAGAAGIGAVAVFGGALVGTHYLMEGLGALGDRLGPGYADLLQGVAGLGLLLAGPRLARGAKPAPRIRETGGRRLHDLSTTDKYLKADAKAPKAYEAIRNDNTDVAAIAKNTGWSEARIARIKEHVFFKKHQLDDGVKRFDEDPSIVNAWDRLKTGDFVESDMQLLKHELFESKFEGIFKTSYRTAHDAAIRSGRPWNPNLAEE